jgi:hypothetical protein
MDSTSEIFMKNVLQIFSMVADMPGFCRRSHYGRQATEKLAAAAVFSERSS